MSGAASSPADDLAHMRHALVLGRRNLGATWPNPAVGAVLLSADGRIVGVGATAPGGRPHAEPQALAMAGAAARGGTLYVTLEPCSHHGRTPPCVDAIVEAGVARVVVALGDPDPRVAGRGFERLQAAGIEVITGVATGEARRDLAGHLRRICDNRPHVLLKLAISADGKAALPGNRPAAITSQAARARAHLARAQADAIMIGIGTVLADDPELTCRLPGLTHRSPVRVVLDADLRLPANGQMARSARQVPVWVIACERACPQRERALSDMGVEIMRVPANDGRLELPRVLELLAGQGITRLMLEGGPTLATSFARAGLIDEAMIFAGPVELGAGAPPADPEGALAALLAGPLVAWRDETWGADRLTLYERG